MGSLIVALLLFSATPAYVQDQQPNVAKLKADAQKVVSMIQGDKTKARVYCQINALDEQIGEADRNNDGKKAEALSKQVTELEKKLGPEYFALELDLIRSIQTRPLVRRSIRCSHRSMTPVWNSSEPQARGSPHLIVRPCPLWVKSGH
jgi:hypothetical protein